MSSEEERTLWSRQFVSLVRCPATVSITRGGVVPAATSGRDGTGTRWNSSADRPESDFMSSKTSSLFLWITLSVCCHVAFSQRLDLYEGDVCKQQGGSLWTCKQLKNCPKAQENLRNKGLRPQICNFVGSDPIVCCEPEVIAPPKGGKSKEKCEQYAKSVFLEFDDPLGDGVVKYDSCAVVEPLITNGQNTEPREYPHMALIGFGEKNNINWLCGGSLISERFVISAAHCVDGGNKGLARWVRLGDYNVQSKSDEDSGSAKAVEYEIVQRITHPEWKPPSLYNDIVLFKLESDVEFNEFVRPICLQTDHQFSKTYAIATGWGRTEYGGRGSDILQKVNITLSARKDCSKAYEKAIGPKLQKGIIDETMFCAGDIANGKDTCQGDSGGPLQLRLKEPYCMYSIVGITSFGDKCASDKPGVYTRVSHYVPWIESVVWP